MYPYLATTAKQINGKIKEKFTSGMYPRICTSANPEPPQSKILPCKTGIKAPPTIAITKPAEPILASSPHVFQGDSINSREHD